MKPLHQVNIEEFRVRYDFTIDQVTEMLQLPASKYESIKHKALSSYSYHPEIKEFFIAGMEIEIRDLCERYEICLCTKQKEILENTFKIKNTKAIDVLHCSLNDLIRYE